MAKVNVDFQAASSIVMGSTIIVPRFMKLRLIAIVLFLAPPIFSASIDATFSSNYIMTSLGAVTGVAGPYGGLTFEAGNSNVLLLGGNADAAGGVIDAITVTRDPTTQHITGFSGSAVQLSTAPFIDGGLTYGPGGDLFFTAYPTNQVGEIKLGDASPDSTVDSGTTPSVGSIDFVPSGFADAGDAIIGSYDTSTFCVTGLTPDGSGTYTFGSCIDSQTTSGGPEGLVYVPTGSPDFTGQDVLVSLFNTGNVDVYQADSNGVPIPDTAATFISGLSGAQGAVIDPVTGDFLFSTFGVTSEIVEVSGFSTPALTSASPEPSSLLLGGLALAGLAWRASRRRTTLKG